MGSIFYALLAAVAGTGQPVQAAINAKLKDGLGSPSMASAVQFAIATALLAVAARAGLLGRGSLAGAGNVPWWGWLGGAIGAVTVTVNLVAVQKVAAATTIGSALVGQLIAAAVLDHFGWLGVERIPLNGWRIVGLLMLFGGIFFVQKR
jgi:transporter family-2 protein